MRRKGLSARDEAFVAAYDGNAEGTLRRIGYEGSEAAAEKAAYRIMGRPEIIAALKKRELREARPAIADRRERQEFWTKGMRGELPGVDRVRASELLGKSEADFTENVKVSGGLSLEQSLVLAMRRRRSAS